MAKHVLLESGSKELQRIRLQTPVVRRLAFLLIGVVLFVALFFIAGQLPGFTDLLWAVQPFLWVVAVIGLLVITWLIIRYLRSIDRRMVDAERQVEEAHQRQDSIYRLNQKFIEASDENEVIQPLLHLLVNLTGAQGATFVPLDEHGYPQTALSHGELPAQVNEGWSEYLASEAVRGRCQFCDDRQPLERPVNCPLLKGYFSDATGLFCVPVRLAERDFGVINLFMADRVQFDERTRMFIRALINETALGLEGVHLRRREFAALRQMQVLRQQTDLKSLLSGLLENTCRSLEADFGVMALPYGGYYLGKIDLVYGALAPQERPFLDGVLQKVMTSKAPVLLEEDQLSVIGDPETEIIPLAGFDLQALLAAPLLDSERVVLGAVLLGVRLNSVAEHRFNQRHLALLQIVAGQVALVVQNASLMADLEYKTMIQERARLAREIHDGLAQTIGYLKLQAAQMRKYLEYDEVKRARESADRLYMTLSETYEDARQAIDSLRIKPEECDLTGWLAQICNEFQEMSAIPVDLVTPDVSPAVDHSLAPEIHAQLIRIVQEALSNIRKHAHARQVWVVLCQDGIEPDDELVLEVRDDGTGFSLDDLPPSSQHGLRGMRERAELIGADLQVISDPQAGTMVRVRLPFQPLRFSKGSSTGRSAFEASLISNVSQSTTELPEVTA